ncbi:putative DNA binding domain-containing protein [Bifidobacterium sp. MA2]|uniref:DNA binding domain-containing protein n=1 Tax=Bifidobacterium santillanense TaxID=2809028 RepID=A0ABS5UPI6_9BIFI|nr:ATP-binding protein [Bifidobacterium santillanense]MBT1172827.1 putative DNA binding domain-containing protein [Bifidobacterium santillanense]
MDSKIDEAAVFSRMDESQYFDRKSARIKPEDVTRHIIAFANASGGQLVIGIEDKGAVTGFKRENAKPVESFEQIPITQCAPSPRVAARRIPCVNAKGQDDVILVLDVSPSSNHVIARRSNGDVYLREGDNSVLLDREQVLALEYDKGQRWFEDEPETWANPDDLDHDVLDRYKRSIGAADIPDERVLRSRGFLMDGKLTNAGVLLFTENPAAFLPSARVRVLKIDGTQLHTGRNLNIVKDEEFDGPLPEVVEQSSRLIGSLLREFQVLGEDGRFRTVSEYPRFAWFEGLVNAVAHRDYSIRGEYTRVMIFDDRLEITSPGALPNRVTLENMRTTRYARNPKICHVLTAFELVRELNEGVHRMYEEMEELGLPDPEYSEPNDVNVKLVLRNNIRQRVPYLNKQQDENPAISQTEIPGEGLTELERRALAIAASDGKVTTRALAAESGVSARTASKTLKKMAGEGILEWHGSRPRDPRQYYAYFERRVRSTSE